jgi:site-specific recombinase XerD
MLRLMECVRLRVKDVDFEQNQITVREGKGFKDRVTMLPGGVKGSLAACRT